MDEHLYSILPSGTPTQFPDTHRYIPDVLNLAVIHTYHLEFNLQNLNINPEKTSPTMQKKILIKNNIEFLLLSSIQYPIQIHL